MSEGGKLPKSLAVELLAVVGYWEQANKFFQDTNYGLSGHLWVDNPVPIHMKSNLKKLGGLQKKKVFIFTST